MNTSDVFVNGSFFLGCKYGGTYVVVLHAAEIFHEVDISILVVHKLFSQTKNINLQTWYNLPTYIIMTKILKKPIVNSRSQK